MFMSDSTANTVVQDGASTMHSSTKCQVDASKKAGEIILGNAGGAEVTERRPTVVIS
jgi:hypothetical protein